MKQFLYIALLLIGFQAGAFTADDSLAVEISGGTMKKQTGDRQYIKTNNPKIYMIKCIKNPKVVCLYVASISDDAPTDNWCPASVSQSTFIPEPYYSMQFNPQKTYIGIPEVTGGVMYYQVNSASMECITGQEGQEGVLVQFDPPLDLED